MAQSSGNSETGTLQTPPANSNAGKQQQQPQNNSSGVQNQDSGTDEPSPLSLAEMFADENSDGENSQNDVDDPSKPVDSIDRLVKRLGVKPEQVYAIKVPMPNGAEPVTIGDLKDRVGELVDFEARELQFDQRRIKAEGDLLRAQTEMRELLAMVPKEHVKPEVVEKVRKRHEETMRRERVATLEHIPQWQDEKTRTEDLQGMVELLSDYGFDESFISTVVDHRALKFIRDMYLRDKKIKAALAKVTTPTKKGQRPSGRASKGAQKPNSQNQRKSVLPDQRSRIMSIFSED